MAESEPTSQNPKLAKYLFVAAAILISAIVSYPWPRRSAPLIPTAQRKALSDFTLEQLDGGTWQLNQHHGQIVLINYWASWCGPCRTETPGIVRMANDTKDLAVVGISMDVGDRTPVHHFIKQMKVDYPIAFPEPMSQMATGMVGLPTSILIDRQGRVAKTYIGETRENEFRTDVAKLQGES
jgi:cytochrome c biogenesis protein CcmG, thiol:disulfide interchange protein DsbE